MLKNHLLNISSYYLRTIPIVSYKYSLFNFHTLFVKSEDLLIVLTFLRNHINCQYQILTCVSGVDFPYKTKRFEIIYELLSVRFNSRLRVKIFTDELTPVASCFTIFPGATWWEREIWDLFGVFFDNNPNMNRLLTDYGFEGHPLRKDFPLSGYIEVRYDERKKRILCEEIEHAQELRSFNFISGW